MTQAEFAKSLGVSVVLISMVETGQKDVSKNLLIRLAEKLDVHPSSITPFLFITENDKQENLTGIEKSFIKLGEKLQEHLIMNRAKLLKKHAK